MKPLITIVTISFNQVLFLEDCIRSTEKLLNQDIQHLIIDAGSVDGSRELLSRWSSKRSNLDIIFEPDDGPADGLNKGLSLAKGEWVCFLNSDDFFLEQGLSRLADTLQRSENFDFVYGHGLKFKDNKIEAKIVSDFSEFCFISNQLKMFQQSTAFRNSFLREKEIRFNTKNLTCWDLEFCLDVVKSGSRNKKVNEFFGGFRIHSESISGSGQLELIYKNDISNLKMKSNRNYGPVLRISAMFITTATQVMTRIRFFYKIRRVKNENTNFSN